jgi:hypothetical protein
MVPVFCTGTSSTHDRDDVNQEEKQENINDDLFL